ncbi:MAG: TonB-dependent receptor plug domain-containing protein, partial [Saprospiraceae bacterium]|nr:TonB-dependent receptor plug domain-containing protein [Saprospiraceae bacterium]
MRRILPLFLSCFFMYSFAVAQTSLQGKVLDAETKEELIGANIVLYKSGVYAAGASTDFDGNYRVSVDPGTYDVEVTYVGYATQRTTDVVVKAGRSNSLDIELGGDEGILLDEVVVIEYKVPLIDKDNTTSGGVITSDQIRNLPTKDITALAATTAGLSQADEGDNISIRGSRADGTDYYIDGIRVRGSGSMVPQSEIDQLQVITGGIEAQYGDVTGGIISITTKGPSSKFSGGIDIETSEFLDSYGYNLGSANISGPIIKKKSGESILGFRLSAQYLSRLDDDPPGTDIFRVKADKLAELEAQPVVLVGATPAIAAEFLTDDDVEILDYQPNEERERLDLTGKLDLRVSKAVDLTFSGSYANTLNRFTPSENTRSTSHWRLMNSQNNPQDETTRYRGNFRFRHRLGLPVEGAEPDEETASAIISNIQYTLQGSYEKSLFEREDWHHKDNLFAYGHVGTFSREWVPSLVGMDSLDNSTIPPTQTTWVQHVDYTETFTGYDPSTSSNPGLAAYNQYNGETPEELIGFNIINGLTQNPITSAWGYHTNVNQVYNLYQKTDNDLMTGNVTVNFDLNPGGSNKGTHSIQLGFIYEQRYNRGYDLNPRALWQVGRQLANNHIIGLDTSIVLNTVDVTDPDLQTFGATANIHPIITTDLSPDGFATNLFYDKLREVTGTDINAFDNLDALNPNQLDIGMFSFSELNSAYSDLGLDFYGFDYRGNKVSNTTTFDDFFTATETINGRTYRSHPVAPINPIYFAGYIQDKFSFRDIIFRVGVRVDRYDANTKVLRDPFSLYDIQSAAEFNAVNGGENPGAVQDDYKVYVTSDGGSAVKAYRDGDQWYNEEGVPVNDGNQIFEGVVFPSYAQGQLNEIQNPDFNPDVSFEDYEPQFNVMPRLAFSFPISDAAGFFAHYDILVQRPSAVGVNVDRATALDYYNFESTQTRANPNLRPQKTIDYEVGFQQKISNASALKIAAYYKELRDMIANRTY